MPLYEYQCDACGRRFEIIQRFSDPLASACPSCKGPVRKLMSSPAIQFKGTGWYVTDYARKGAASSDNGAAAPKDTSKDTDGKASKAADKKSESGSKSEASTKTTSEAAPQTAEKKPSR